VIVRFRKNPLILLVLLLWSRQVSCLGTEDLRRFYNMLASNRVSVTPAGAGKSEKDLRRPGEPGAGRRGRWPRSKISTFQMTYEDAKGGLEAQRATLDLLKAGSRPEEIERRRSGSSRQKRAGTVEHRTGWTRSAPCFRDTVAQERGGTRKCTRESRKVTQSLYKAG